MEEKLEDAARRAANERSRLQDEIAQLKEFLGAAKASKKVINDELGNVRLEAEASTRQVQSLQATVQALELEKADVSESTTACHLPKSRPYSSKKLYRPLVLRKLICFGKARGILWEWAPHDPARMTTFVTKLLASSMCYPFHRLLLRRFVRHIVQELQKENSAHVSKIKSLENENKLLRSEAEELKAVRNPDIPSKGTNYQKGCEIAGVYPGREHRSRGAGPTTRRNTYRPCKRRFCRIATGITGESGQIRGRLSGTLCYQSLCSPMFRANSKDCARKCQRQNKRVIRQSLRYGRDD